MTRAMTPAESAFHAAQAIKPPLYPRNRQGNDRVQAIAVLIDLPEALRKRRPQWARIPATPRQPKLVSSAPGRLEA